MNAENVKEDAARERALQAAAWTLIRGLIDGDPTGRMQARAEAWKNAHN